MQNVKKQKKKEEIDFYYFIRITIVDIQFDSDLFDSTS